MRPFTPLALLTIATGIVCAPALAQQFVLPATVETISATDGFGSRAVAVTAGPPASDQGLIASCGGAVGAAAQVHFFYTSGAHTLTISAASQSSVTLLVADPSGQWRCAAESLAPTMSFESPHSGRYAIWVGAIDAPGSATVTIEEHAIDAAVVN